MTSKPDRFERDCRGVDSTPKYDPELTTSLITKARLLVATDEAFLSPDMRAVDRAIRLVASGPKACAVSASECHEISENVIAAYDRDAFPIRAHTTIAALVDQLEAAPTYYDKACELRAQLEKEQHDSAFFRAQAEERGRELREALVEIDKLSAPQRAEGKHVDGL